MGVQYCAPCKSDEDRVPAHALFPTLVSYPSGLRAIISSAISENRLWTTDWTSVPLPDISSNNLLKRRAPLVLDSDSSPGTAAPLSTGAPQSPAHVLAAEPISAGAQAASAPYAGATNMTLFESDSLPVTTAAAASTMPFEFGSPPAATAATANTTHFVF